jgi:hypothetical protein
MASPPCSARIIVNCRSNSVRQSLGQHSERVRQQQQSCMADEQLVDAIVERLGEAIDAATTV